MQWQLGGPFPAPHPKLLLPAPLLGGKVVQQDGAGIPMLCVWQGEAGLPMVHVPGRGGAGLPALCMVAEGGAAHLVCTAGGPECLHFTQQLKTGLPAQQVQLEAL